MHTRAQPDSRQTDDCTPAKRTGTSQGEAAWKWDPLAQRYKLPLVVAGCVQLLAEIRNAIAVLEQRLTTHQQLVLVTLARLAHFLVTPDILQSALACVKALEDSSVAVALRLSVRLV